MKAPYELHTYPGVTFGLPFDQYLQLPGESASALKKMMVSPLNYKWAKEHPTKSTPAMAIGTATHAAVLEPHRMKTDFILWTGGARKSKAWDLFKEAAGDRQILNETEWSEVVAMHDSVRSNPLAMKYLAEGVAEVTLVWTDPHTGIVHHARVDWVTVVDGKLVFVDLKTTRDASYRKFCADAYKLGYHIQFGLYVDGGFYIFGETPRFVVIAVENKPPYDCAVYTVPDEVLQQGHDEYLRYEETIAACRESGFWPGRSTCEMELTLPSWATDNDETDLSDLELVTE